MGRSHGEKGSRTNPWAGPRLKLSPEPDKLEHKRTPRSENKNSKRKR